MKKKLTNQLRDAIVERTIKATFKDREDEVKRLETEFADHAYATLVPDHFKVVAQSLPPEYFRQTEGIVIQYREGRESGSDIIHELPTASATLLNQSRFLRNGNRWEMTKARPFPCYQSETFSSSARLSLDDSDACRLLQLEHSMLIKRASAIVEERTDLRDRLNGMLQACRTVAQLIAMAPELIPFIPGEALVDRPPPPAPIIGTLITDLMASGLKLTSAAQPC